MTQKSSRQKIRALALTYLLMFPTLRFFDSKTCYQPTPYDLPSTLINYPSQVQAEVTL